MGDSSIILMRVSSDMQDNEMQRKECLEYAEKNNMNVLKVLESKVSGYKTLLEDMVNLQEVIKLASQGLIQNVVFWKVDRIGRQMEFLTFFETMERHSVTLHSVTEGIIQGRTTSDKLMLILKLFSAETEAENTSLRVKTAFKLLNETPLINEKGELEDVYIAGSIPFGTHLVDTGYVRNPKKGTTLKRVQYMDGYREIVERIFNMYLYEGKSTEKIARWLNENNIPRQKSKNPWDSALVQRLLTNTAYIGKMRYNTSEFKTSKSKQKVRKPKSEWKYKNMPQLRVISDDEHIRVLSILKERNTKKNKTTNGKSSEHVLLGGLCVCGVCGSKMFLSNTKKFNQKKGEYRLYYYQCKNAKLHKDGRHKQVSFSAPIVDDVFYNKLLNVIEEYDFDTAKLDADLDTHNMNIMKKLTKTVDTLEGEVKEKEEVLDGLQKEVGLSLVGKSKFNSDLLATLIENTENELRELKASLLENKSQLLQAQDNVSDKLAKMETFKNFKVLAKEATFEELQQLVRSIVKKVVLQKGEMEIVLSIHE